MRYVIGLDAGGTKTVGLLADESGKILSKARGGGANLLVHGELAVEKVVYQFIEDLEAPEPISAICLGIAGVESNYIAQGLDTYRCYHCLVWC